jgi:pimeloyl-ACP methyl ester carboxylesterase
MVLSLIASFAHAAPPTAPAVKNIVLVHGAFADGSSWARVIPLLQAKGYNVTAVQNPLTSFADDVATTKRALARQDGPTILVGHSWGGVVITEAGMDPKVVGPRVRVLRSRPIRASRSESWGSSIRLRRHWRRRTSMLRVFSRSPPMHSRNSDRICRRAKRSSLLPRRGRSMRRHSARRSLALRGRRSRPGTSSPRSIKRSHLTRSVSSPSA